MRRHCMSIFDEFPPPQIQRAVSRAVRRRTSIAWSVAPSIGVMSHLKNSTTPQMIGPFSSSRALTCCGIGEVRRWRLATWVIRPLLCLV